MRHTELFARLTQAPTDLSTHLASDTRTGRPTIVDAFALREKLSGIKDLPVLGTLAQDILTHQAFRVASDVISIESNDAVLIRHGFERYANTFAALMSLLAPTCAPGPTTFYVKLHSADTLSSVVRSLDDLDLVLNQATSVIEGEPPCKVKTWESGSLWIAMLAGSVSGLILIGGLTWIAACAYRKYQEAMLIQEYARGLKEKNKLLESINESLQDAINEIINAEVKRLDERHSTKKGIQKLSAGSRMLQSCCLRW